MNIRQVQAFLAVTQTMSFAAAAEQLHLSQPALSLAVKGLEENLGGKLFTRTTRSLALTPEGEAFAPIARSILARWQSAEEEMKQRFVLQKGRISIAAMPSFAASVLPEAMRNYHRLYPNIHVSIDDVLSDTVVEMVSRHQVELGVTFQPDIEHTGMEYYPLYEDRFIAVLPPEHPLTERSSVSWQQLLQYDYIALQRPSSVRAMIESALQAADIPLTVAFDAHQLTTVNRMVSVGMGVAVVPALCRQQAVEQGAVCRPVTGPEIRRSVGVVCKPRESLSVAAAAMLDVLIGTYASADAHK